MSNPDDSSRLSETLERLLGGTTATPEARTDDSGDDPDAAGNGAARRTDADDVSSGDGSGGVEPYELPEIVPATADPTPADDPAAVEPTLPARDIRPRPGPSSPAARTDPLTAPSASPAPPLPPVTAAPAPAAPTAATSWSDHVAPATAAGSPLRAPGRRPRVRRVTRVLRHIDPWSTFKVALLFSAVAYVVTLTSGVLLWRVADSTGTLANVERWFTQFGWETFELQGGEIFRNAWIMGLFGVVFATGGAVLLVTLFNLVSDIVGGVRLTVLEEEVVERTASSRRRYIVRAGSDLAAATAATAPAWSVDDDRSDAPTPTPSDAGRPTGPTTVEPGSGTSTRTDTDATEPTAEQPTSRPAARAPSAARADDDWSVD